MISFSHVDNLGFGQLSCYTGGPFRGAVKTRIDAFADERIVRSWVSLRPANAPAITRSHQFAAAPTRLASSFAGVGGSR